MPPDRDLAYLSDMLAAARGLIRSVSGKTLDCYLSDEDLRRATERRLEIIGEAARRLSDGFRDAHSVIPWRKVIGLRNIIAHQYDDVDDEQIWRLTCAELPRLIGWLDTVVAELPPELESEN
jgi:uncharacterized protein with HEPN domain